MKIVDASEAVNFIKSIAEEYERSDIDHDTAVDRILAGVDHNILNEMACCTCTLPEFIRAINQDGIGDVMGELLDWVGDEVEV